MSWGKLALVLLLSGTLSGCLFRKKPAVAPPPPPPLPSPVRPAPPEPMAPPAIDPPAQALPADAAPQLPERNLPPPPPPPSPRRRPARSAPAPAAPKEPVEEEAPAPAPSPQLGEVIPAEQRAEFRRVFDESAGQARQALGRVEGRTLSGVQQQTAARIRAFLAQAESLIETDVRSAAELARRAALLSRDLLGSIR